MTTADRQYRNIRLRRDGSITVITINRPERMNALHHDAQQELAHAFDAFVNDSEQFVAILTGEGQQAFCAGLDLKALVEGGSSEGKLPSTGVTLDRDPNGKSPIRTLSMARRGTRRAN